jgi:hypothetical protein
LYFFSITLFGSGIPIPLFIEKLNFKRMTNYSNGSNATAAAFIFMLTGITVWGYLAWNYIQPTSYGTGAAFVACWGALSFLSTKITTFIAFRLFSQKWH